MSTISEKLDLIDEIREDIKDAIEDQGVSISSSDTFRSYADKIRQITGESHITAEPITFTENGMYTAQGEDHGYSPVTVNVPGLNLNGEVETVATAASSIKAKETVYIIGSGDGWQDITKDVPVNTSSSKIINSSGTKVYEMAYSNGYTIPTIYCYDTTVTPWVKTTITLAPSESNIEVDRLYQFGDFGFTMFYDSDLDQKGVWIIDLNLGVLALTITEQPVLRAQDCTYQNRYFNSLRQYGQRVFPNGSGGWAGEYYFNTFMVINLQTQKIENYALSNGWEMYGITFISEDDFLLVYHNEIVKCRRSMSTVKDGAYQCSIVWDLDLESMISGSLCGDEPSIIYANGKAFIESEVMVSNGGATYAGYDMYKHLYYLENVEQDDQSKVTITEITNLPEGYEFDASFYGDGDLNSTPDFQKLLTDVREISSKKTAWAALDTKTLTWDIIGYINSSGGSYGSMNSGQTLAFNDGHMFKQDPAVAYPAHNGIHGSYSLGYSPDPVAKDQKGTFRVVYTYESFIVGGEYIFGNYYDIKAKEYKPLKWICAEDLGNGKYAMQSFGMTGGTWPGYKLASDYSGQNSFGQEGHTYSGNINDLNVANYDSVTLKFYDTDNWKSVCADNKGLYLLATTKVDDHFPAGTYKEGMINAASRGNLLVDPSLVVNRAFLGERGLGSSGVWTINNQGSTENRYSQTDYYVIAPCFNIDSSKVNVNPTTNEITIK